MRDSFILANVASKPRSQKGGAKRASTPGKSASRSRRVSARAKGDLTFQQSRFVDELLADPEMNATRAAQKAYPSQTYAAAKAQGSENLQKPHIAAEVKRRMAPALVKARMTKDRVLSVIGDGMNWDPADAYNPDGSFKDVRDMPPEVRRQIAGIDIEEIRLAKDGPVVGHTKKIRFIDRTRHVELAARHHKLLVDKVEIVGASGRADRLARARARRDGGT